MQVVQQVLELGPFSDPPQLNVGEDFLWNKNIQIDKLCKIIIHEGRRGLSAEMSKCMVQISRGCSSPEGGCPNLCHGRFRLCLRISLHALSSFQVPLFS